MTWVKLDDQYPQHPRIVGLSDAAFRAHVTGLCYCSAFLTDGHIPRAVVAKPKAAAELVSAGLWEPTDDGWMIPTYLDHQRSRAEAEALSLKRQTAGKKGGKAKAAAKQLASKPEAENREQRTDTAVVNLDDDRSRGGRGSSSFDPDADVFLKAGYIAARSKPAGKIRDLDDYAAGCARSIERERGHLLPELRAQGKTDDEIALALVDRNCATDVELGWLDEPMKALP